MWYNLGIKRFLTLKEKKMKTITRSELVSMLENVSGNTFVNIETETIPKTKKGCSFNLKRLSSISGCIGFNYTNSVNHQRQKEGLSEDFKAVARVWGNRIKGTPIVEHKGKKYIEVKVQSATSDFFSNSTRISLDKVIPWLYNSETRQGVDNEVVVRDYKIENITRIKINKEEYKVI